MAISNVDFSVTFVVDKTQSYFVITDTTDYASQSVTTNDVEGLIKVVSPSGIVYDNTDFSDPDLELVTSRVNRAIIVPTYVGTNNPLKGTYTISLTSSDDSGVTKFTRTKVFQYDLNTPVPLIDVTVDCISPQLKSEDKTVYNLNSVNPATSFPIVYASTGSSSIGISGNKVGAFIVGSKVNVQGSTANNGEYTISSVIYNKTSDRTEIVFSTSVDSNLGDGLVYTRVNNIYYPGVLDLTPDVSFTSVITTTSFYTGNQEFKSEGYFNYAFASDFSVTFYLIKTESKNITCDIRLCDIYCCISKTLNNYLNYKGVNDVLANNYKNAYILACSYLTSLQTQMQCGNTTNLDKVVAEIRSVTGCTTDCNCEDSENVLIQGVSNSNNVEVVSSSNELRVVKTVSGSTSLFTLSLDSSIATALANIKDVTLEDSATIDVNEVIDVNGNKTYTPSIATGVIPDVIEKMSFSLLIEYRFTPSLNPRPSLNFTVSNFEVDAQLDYVQPTVEDRSSISLPPDSMNLIALRAFQSSSDNVKVFAEVVKTVGYNSQDNTISDSSIFDVTNNLEVKIVKASANDIAFTLNDGIPMSTQSYITSNYQSVLVNFIITK
jgi:hypothetical protein